jgi:hypothetical protein
MIQSSQSGNRNSAFDYSKGMLVLLMVLYHWINYFVSTVGPIYTYLRFVTPSFIFITGFLISNIYPERYIVDQRQISRRLFVRGAKLLLLFTLLNIIANALFGNNYRGEMPGVEGFLRNASSIYISGTARASFWVLLPISYLLLFCSGLFLVCRVNKLIMGSLCAVSLLFAILLNVIGYSSPNVEMMAIGLLGMACGTVSAEAITGWASNLPRIICMYGAYLILISFMGVSYFLQIIGVCLSLLLIYATGLKWWSVGLAGRQTVLLGQYSLFGYVAQIGILHFLHRGMSQLHLHAVVVLVLSFVAAVGLTLAAVNAVHALRERSSVIRELYRVAFS